MKIDLPAAMVERELDREMASLEVRLAELGLRFDRYLEYTGGSVEKLRQDRRPAAADNVRLELALDALARAEQLEVDELQVEREMEKIAVGRRLSAGDRRRLRTAARTDLVRRAAAERAYEIASGTPEAGGRRGAGSAEAQRGRGTVEADPAPLAAEHQSKSQPADHPGVPLVAHRAASSFLHQLDRHPAQGQLHRLVLACHARSPSHLARFSDRECQYT